MAKKQHPPATKRGNLPQGFSALLGDVKLRIQAAQTRAVTAVNAELVRLYWDIGRLIDQRQQAEGWGAGVIPRLAAELRNDLPEVKGFSERNIKSMLAFCRAYPDPGLISQPPVAKLPASPIVQQAVAQLPDAPKVPRPVAQLAATSLLWQIPSGHHVMLLVRVKDASHRRW